MPRPFGKTHGLKPSQLQGITRLAHRRTDRERLVGVDLARELGERAFDLGRNVGVLLDRGGQVQRVLIGDRAGVPLPGDLGPPPAPGRLSGLRLIRTEIGGLCFLAGGGLVFKSYDPGRCLGDNQYVESPLMMSEAVYSLARWHCHADSWRGRELAGPGPDDLRYAAYLDSPVVVITYVNDKTCNIDYFTPEGIVIDLGNY